MVIRLHLKLTQFCNVRLGVFAPAALLLPLLVGPATAQVPTPQALAPPASARPVPGDLELAKLIWSTMAMVDQANRSGNYSVLRDTAASDFQINNNPAQLAQIFGSLRTSRVDLSNTLLLTPTYATAPALVKFDVFHVRGMFGLRPTAIAFDLFFQWEHGSWRLVGISILPEQMATSQPVTAPPPLVRASPRRGQN